MMLFTAEGLLDAFCRADSHRFALSYTSAIYQAYLRWLHTQGIALPQAAIKKDQNGGLVGIPALHACRAPGKTCLQALRSGLMGTIKQPINKSKGCGGVMRVAPVGLLGSRQGWEDATIFQAACEAAAITHGHPTGYLAAGCLGIIIARIMAGAELLEAILASMTCLKSWAGHEECLAAIGAAVCLAQSPSERPGPGTVARLGQGWIAEEALAISLYCALVAGDNFARGVLLSVNHSGDSDSTGSITGNILGALLGQEAIPKQWLEWLELRAEISEMASNLLMVPIGLAGDAAEIPSLISWMPGQ